MYSFIVPVYNRPNEIDELLESFCNLDYDRDFEIVIVEDGSQISSQDIVSKYNTQLSISYYSKENSGPGDSRNFGMRKAKGNYFIILDSDVLLPKDYLSNVDAFLYQNFYHCFGGPDTAHTSFTLLQKAINFAMTSFISTGGIRGGGELIEDFQPRSFNMGLSQEAFKNSGGFGKIHPGEDPDLALRLQSLGYKTVLINTAKVYHKRRISWSKFYKQVNKFGSVRPILNCWHPKSKSIVFWFPTLFSIGFLLALVLSCLGHLWVLLMYFFYFLLVFIIAVISTKSLIIGTMAVFAVTIQFYGYGKGFLVSTMKLMVSNKAPEQLFPKLFFK